MGKGHEHALLLLVDLASGRQDGVPVSKGRIGRGLQPFDAAADVGSPQALTVVPSDRWPEDRVEPSVWLDSAVFEDVAAKTFALVRVVELVVDQRVHPEIDRGHGVEGVHRRREIDLLPAQGVLFTALGGPCEQQYEDDRWHHCSCCQARMRVSAARSTSAEVVLWPRESRTAPRAC